MSAPFPFCCPTRLHCGKPFDAAAAEMVGDRPWALITSHGWIARGGLARLEEHLGPPVVAITNVTENPTVDSMMALGPAFPEVPVVLALGGGSVMDLAKALLAFRGAGANRAALQAHLCDGVPLVAPRIPVQFIAIPTTSGSGSEVTPWGTLWDGLTKRSVNASHLRPSDAVLDPQLCLSMPRALTLATGLDAASHALESIWNRRHTPLTDALASQALALLREYLSKALEQPGCVEVREKVQVASLLAGLAINSTQTALAHSLSYPFTARFHMPHGLAVGFTVAEVARFNAAAVPERMHPIAVVFDCSPAAVPEALHAWLDSLGVPEAVVRYAGPGVVQELGSELLHPARAVNNIRPAGLQAARKIIQDSLVHAALRAARIFGAAPAEPSSLLQGGTMSNERKYASLVGARILETANDLKRTPEVLAEELGLDEAMVRTVIAGEANVAASRALLERMASTYPISLSELWVEPPDTDQGVRWMAEAESRRSARVFSRKDGLGRVGPYLEYRDTAMSRLAPYKPEWVKALRVVGDADPNNPLVVYNNGHLMHQFTFFVGEVNAYWEIDGHRSCVELNTGDSTYAAPYVPHSFASRNPERLGLLIAVTYAGEAQRALNAFAQIGGEAAAELAGNLRHPRSVFRALLRRYQRADSLSTAQLAQRLSAAGMEEARARALARAEVLPEHGEVELLAKVLGVRRGDLLPDAFVPGEEVVVHRIEGSDLRPYPDTGRPAYLLREMARTPLQPGLRGLELRVLEGAGEEGIMQHHLHEYVYNFGDTPVTLHWGASREIRLGPGDSAYVEPLVPHRFSRVEGEGQLVVIRVPGALTDSVLQEFSSYAPERRTRIAGENMRWF
jgi:alcohol dehydrogenase class IV/mannose-6-phosphate isomerase-like protein (cupin superfamily)